MLSYLCDLRAANCQCFNQNIAEVVDIMNSSQIFTYLKSKKNHTIYPVSGWKELLKPISHLQSIEISFLRFLCGGGRRAQWAMQGLLLTLRSWITPGGTHEALCGVRARTWVSSMLFQVHFHCTVSLPPRVLCFVLLN